MRMLLATVALAMVPLAACTRGPVVPSLVAPAALPAAQVRETSLRNGFVTIRVELPAGARGPVPAVISMLGQADALRDLGVAVVTYDLNWAPLAKLAKPPAPVDPNAPRTWGKWLLVSPSPQAIGENYFKLIAGNADIHVPEVLDWLATLPEIDSTRIGIAGISTNGFKAIEAVAVDPRVRAAVVIAASGDYHCFLEKSSLALNGEEPVDLAPEYERWLRGREPIRHPKRFVHAAVLMVNGGKDIAVPGACAVETAKVFERAYAAAHVPERFRFVYVEEGGHDLGETARYEGLAWLYRWLVTPTVDG